MFLSTRSASCTCCAAIHAGPNTTSTSPFETASQQGQQGYICQTLRTRGRCRLPPATTGRARRRPRRFEMAEKIGDRQACVRSRASCSPSAPRPGELGDCESELNKVSEQIGNSPRRPTCRTRPEAQRVRANSRCAQRSHAGRAPLRPRRSIFSILSASIAPRSRSSGCPLLRAHAARTRRRALLARAASLPQLAQLLHHPSRRSSGRHFQIGAPAQQKSSTRPSRELLTLRRPSDGLARACCWRAGRGASSRRRARAASDHGV